MCAKAQDGLWKIIKPEHGQLQFAGNIGLLSAGLGYDLAGDKLHITLMDGFVPASIAGSPINTIALKNAYDIISIKGPANTQVKPYTGITAMFETSGNSFYKKLPERYVDRRYYQYSAFHLAVFAGGKIRLPVGSREGQSLELYAETGTLDSYLYYYFKNKELNFSDLFSAALGFTYHFGDK
jgi:hypothetical protein